MTGRREGLLVPVVAVAALLTAQLSLPGIVVTALIGIGGNFASDSVKPRLPKLGQRLGIRPLIRNALLRRVLSETFEQALERLQNNYHKSPQYAASSEKELIDSVFVSLHTDARLLYTAANVGGPASVMETFPLDDTAVTSRDLSVRLDEYLPYASEHLRSFVAHNLPLFWASSLIERLTRDQDAWTAFQILEWRELPAAVEALPRAVAEQIRGQLAETEPPAEWQIASKEALSQLATSLAASLGDLEREVREQGAETREHVAAEAGRIIEALQEGHHTRAEALAEMGRHIRQKTVGRLRVLGVTQDVADDVANRALSRQVPAEIANTSPGTVLLFRGPLGAGKTTIAEVLLLQAIEAAQHDPNAPIPVFIDTGRMEAPLRDQIGAQCPDLGDPARLGVMAVLDAIEQADPRRAEELLAESIAITQTWPSTRVIVTGRADFEGPQGIPIYDVPQLFEDEWLPLAQEVAGHSTRIFASAYPESVQQAVARPLFAILLGIWVREPAYLRPPTSAALIRHLIERSLNRAGVDRPELSACLRVLAARAVESGGRTVRLYQAPDGPILRQALLDTGIVSIDQTSRVAFTLAIFAEWFAGQELLWDPNMLADADVDRIVCWRYAIVAAVAAADHDQAGLILTPLVRTAPAIAGWAIRNALHTEQRPEPDGDVDSTEEWAQLIVTAMDSWRQAMGPLARVTTPSTHDGQPAALGLRVLGTQLEYGWSKYPGRIMPLPHGSWDERSGDWIESGLTVAPADSPFEWLFTWEWVRKRLEVFLKNALLRPLTPVLQAEYDWHVAQIVAGWSPSGRHCDAVPLEALEEFIGRFAVYAAAQLGNRRVTVRQVRDILERHREHGSEFVANPWPCSDQNTGWIPSAWSAKRRLERLQQVCEAALEGYVVAVNRYFPSFQTQLRTFASMPIKLRGYMSVLSEARGYQTFRDDWYMEPRPEGEPNSVEWIQVDAPPEDRDLWEVFLSSRLAHRPGLPRVLTVSGRVPGLESSRPAMNLLATLLWRDFHAWEWVPLGGPDLSNTSYLYDPIPDSIYWAQPNLQADL